MRKRPRRRRFEFKAIGERLSGPSSRNCRLEIGVKRWNWRTSRTTPIDNTGLVEYWASEMRIFDFTPSRLGRFDFVLAALTLALALAGALIIYGAGGAEGSAAAAKAQKHSIFICLGVAAFLICCLLDIKTVELGSWPFYGIVLAMLFGLIFLGESSHGARSWYRFGPLSVQPSEYAKIAAVLALASYLGRRPGRIERFRSLLIPLAIAGAPAALTLKQNDLGTASIFAPVFLVMVFAAGIRKRVLIPMLIAGVVCAAAALPHLKPHHLMRIAVVLDKRMTGVVMPAIGHDPAKIWKMVIDNGGTWQRDQTLIALGSGKVFGKGWGAGTQTALDWVPFWYNDMVFSGLGEQFGFAGCMLVLAAYVLLVWRGARIARDSNDLFGALLVTGLLTIFVSHIFMNIGMALNLLPIIGLPLPFLSSGGSFLVSMFIVFGLIANVGMRKFLY
jgi:rod shape determining protein RodA